MYQNICRFPKTEWIYYCLWQTIQTLTLSQMQLTLEMSLWLTENAERSFFTHATKNSGHFGCFCCWIRTMICALSYIETICMHVCVYVAYFRSNIKGLYCFYNIFFPIYLIKSIYFVLASFLCIFLKKVPFTAL